MCTNDHGKSSCAGDSGGPLFITEKKRGTIVALVSYGAECNGTSVNAKITENIKTWIYKNAVGAEDSNCLTYSKPNVENSSLDLHLLISNFFNRAVNKVFYQFIF